MFNSMTCCDSKQKSPKCEFVWEMVLSKVKLSCLAIDVVHSVAGYRSTMTLTYQWMEMPLVDEFGVSYMFT